MRSSVLSVNRQEMIVVEENDARLSSSSIKSDKWKEKASFSLQRKRKRLIMSTCVSSIDDDIVQLKRETEQKSIPSGRIDNWWAKTHVDRKEKSISLFIGSS